MKLHAKLPKSDRWTVHTSEVKSGVNGEAYGTTLPPTSDLFSQKAIQEHKQPKFKNMKFSFSVVFTLQFLSSAIGIVTAQNSPPLPVTFSVPGGVPATLTCPSGAFCYVKNSKPTGSSSEASLVAVDAGHGFDVVNTRMIDVRTVQILGATSDSIVTFGAEFGDDATGLFYCSAGCTCVNEDGTPCEAAPTSLNAPTTGGDRSEISPPSQCSIGGSVGNVARCPEVMKHVPLDMTCECGYIFNIGSGFLARCFTSQEFTFALDVSSVFGLCYDDDRFIESAPTSAPVLTPTPAPTNNMDMGSPAPTLAPNSQTIDPTPAPTSAGVAISVKLLSLAMALLATGLL